MSKEEWFDVPVSINVMLEKILPEDLPTLLGQSDKRDKKIAELFQKNEVPPVQWVFKRNPFVFSILNELITIDLPSEYNDVCEIKAEVEGLSTGYYDSGCVSYPAEYCYPPEGGDERKMTSLKFIIYDKDGKELGQYIPEDLSKFNIFEQLLYETDLEQ